ncbi:hypothetical protein Goklo_023470, partial [Gossypium klotzschianum]|nr:hypothetical protein [Gossypium klotzschianum]
SSSLSNSENAELFKNQSDGEKTLTDQDEDIKVSTCNSDGENTSSEDENIEIPDPMDIETTDLYGKRKIESDSQIDDYLRSLNKDFEIDKDTVRIFGNKTENITTNNVKPEYPGETSSQPVHPRIDDLNKRNMAQGGIYLDLTNTPISSYEKIIDDWAQSMTIVVNNNTWSKENFLNYFVGTFQGDVLQFLRLWEESEK